MTLNSAGSSHNTRYIVMLFMVIMIVMLSMVISSWYIAQYRVLADIVGNTVLPFFKQPVKKNTFGHYEEEGLIETYYMIWMVNFRRRAWSRRRRELSERALRLGRRARCATQSCDLFFALFKNISAGGFAVWKYTYKIWIIEAGEDPPDRAVITFSVLPFGKASLVSIDEI